MARKKNANPVGSTVFQVDAGSFSYSAVAENAVGDAALAFDELTGENSGPAHDHSGPGSGSLLGACCSTLFPLDDDNRYSSYSAAANGIGYFFMHPWRVPTGETTVGVDFEIENPGTCTLEVRDASWVRQGEAAVVKDGNRMVGLATGLTGGTLYFVLVKATLDGTLGNAHQVPVSYRVGNPRISSLGLQGFPAEAVASAPLDASAGVLVARSWDTSELAANRAWHAQLTTRLNRFLNGVWELMSGAPAGGGAATSLTTFHDHRRTTYASEGQVDLPIIAEPFGAAPTHGDGDGYLTGNFGAPGLTVTTKTGLAAWVVDLPQLPAAVGTSRLRCCVLFSSPDNTKPAVTLYAQSITGGAEVSAAVTWITGTRFGYAVVTGIDFSAAAVNHLLVSVQSTVAKVDGTSLRALGAHWYFEAP